MPDSATRLFLRYRDRRDGRALARLFDRAAPELLAVAVHLAPDVASAVDLVQATFVAAIEGAGRIDAAREVKPWLFGILATLAVVIPSLGAVALSKSLGFVSLAAVALFVWTTSRGEDVPHLPSIATDTMLHVAQLELPAKANDTGAPAATRTSVITAVESAPQSAAAPAPVAAPEVCVRGRVVDVDGHPVVGARLVLSDTHDRARDGSIGEPTDANGEFDLGSEFQAGRIRACHPDHVTSKKTPIVPGEHLELRLRGPAARLVGQVTDREGQPVEGATVRVALVSPEVRFDDPDGTTDEVGRPELAGLEPGWSTIDVAAIGFIDASTEVALQSGAAQSIELKLQRGRRVVGRVSFADGVWPESVNVSIDWRDHASRYQRGVQPRSDGAFVLGGIPYSSSFSKHADSFARRAGTRSKPRSSCASSGHR